LSITSARLVGALIHPITAPLTRVSPLRRPPAQPPPLLRRGRRSPGGPSSGHRAQPNSRPWGGARQGGSRAAWGPAAFASRWVRIFSIVLGSSMQAMVRAAPPQAQRVSTPRPNARLRRCAQLIGDRRRSPRLQLNGVPLEEPKPPQPAGLGPGWFRFLDKSGTFLSTGRKVSVLGKAKANHVFHRRFRPFLFLGSLMFQRSA
jgi:hypothetical protein